MLVDFMCESEESAHQPRLKALGSANGTMDTIQQAAATRATSSKGSG